MILLKEISPYFTENTANILFSSIAATIITITVAVLLAVAYFFYKRRRKDDYENKYLTLFFVIVWVMGFVVYDIGMCSDTIQSPGEAFGAALGVAPMAIIHAFEMFILQSDVSAIHEGCHNNVLYMFFFSTVHLLAALVSMIFVIKHFGFNVVANIQRFWRTKVCVKNVPNLYVFWGMNDAAYYLAKDIIEKQGGEKNLSRIMVVRVNGDKEGANERLAMERLFSFLSLSKENLNNLQNLQKSGCLTASAFGGLANNVFAEDSDILQGVLRLRSLVRLIRHTSATIHMFFLGEDETFNINALANLRKDKVVKDFADNVGKVRLYCKARYNSIHRVIEDEHNYNNTEVRVIDPSHVHVELLKKKPKLHPVNYVEVENDARVSSAFNALVVGFGTVGVDAVSFLYEFGAFVSAKNVEGGAVKRSEFHCYVVDKRMNELSGSFIANAPSLDVSTNADETSTQHAISLLNLDCQSEDFYKRLVTWLPTLNYVMLTTDNDELNISMAVSIMKLAIRHKDMLDHFSILVRVQGDDNGHIREISEHYNRLWHAEINRLPGELDQTVVRKDKKDENTTNPITLFGSLEGTYTYDNIIDESLKDLAARFKYKYDKYKNALENIDDDESVAMDEWNKERTKLLHINDQYSPTFSEVLSLRRLQRQNFSNCFHTDTKKILFKKAMNLDNNMDVELVAGKINRLKGTKYEFVSGESDANITLEHVQRVLDVLAQTEHLRWNASHEILGYIQGSSKNEAKMWHNCLVEWGMLASITKEFDYNVVDVSLGISMKKTDN